MRRRAHPEMEGIFDFFKERPEAPRRPAPAPPMPPGMPPGVDLYAIFGVPPDASIDRIRAAFREQAFKFHPDRNPGDPVAVREFQRLNDAFTVLEDAEKRAVYDRARAAAAPPPPLPPPPAPIYPAQIPPSAIAPYAPGAAPPARPPAAGPPARQKGLWEVLFAPPEAEPEQLPMRSFFAPFAPPAAPPAAAPPIAPPPPGVRSFFTPPAVPMPAPAFPRPRPEIEIPRPEEIAEMVLNMWPIDAVWDVVRAERATPRFQESPIMTIDRVAGERPETVESELADLFEVPQSWVEESLRAGPTAREALWREVFYPLFERVSAAFDMIKPADLPGRFGLEWDRSGQGIDLLYAELSPAR